MPITYQRSKHDPLDCVFGTSTIQMRNGGCLSFGKLIGDHRGLWLDIPNEILFGFNPQPISHPNARRLKMADPRVVAKYNDYLHNKYFIDRLYERWDYLHKIACYEWTANMEEEYEILDDILEKHTEKAEKQCRKLKMGTIPWLPTY